MHVNAETGVVQNLEDEHTSCFAVQGESDAKAPAIRRPAIFSSLGIPQEFASVPRQGLTEHEHRRVVGWSI